ncbi:MAG: SUMF1/EgtB/PvdO family nonheme iron enzyme [Pseudomonadota bacterium]
MERTLLLTLLLAACGEPGAEICGDLLDNDGDLLVDCFDDDCAAEEVCTDADGDGVTADLDCDDAHANGPEVCDGVDNDCDGTADEDALDADTFYADADGDGYGDAGSVIEACEAPSGYVSDDGDCDDGDAGVNPDAVETCDGVDEDCDGAVDEDAGDAPTWYLDQDGDGYGISTAADREACEPPEGFADNEGDCDDLDIAVGVGCRDFDGDGQSPDEGDCDDEDPGVYSGAVSVHQGIEMAYICPGTFTMGSPEEEVGRDDDETLHEVTLTRGFWLGVYEVTEAEFEGFMAYQPSYWAYMGNPSRPVEWLSWHEAAAFANAVSDAASLARCYDCSGSGDAVTCSLSSAWAALSDGIYACPGYRLPTEAEWEYAARAGTTSAYSNGGNLVDGYSCDASVVLDNGASLDDIANYCANDPGWPISVGSMDPNPWGLFDMHGNVYEWCQDTYEVLTAATDPWAETSRPNRVERGGAWHCASCARSADRTWCAAADSGVDLGLRLARTAE